MKSVCVYIVTIMLFASTAFSAESAVDFDGKNKEVKDITNHLSEPANSSITSSFSKAKEIITPFENDTSEIATVRLIEITESGEKVVEPIITADGERRYEVRPNGYFDWEFRCYYQKNRTEYWRACSFSDFDPTKAGHEHTPSGTLSYLNPDTGQPLPNKVCTEWTPVNSSARIHYKMPVFSALVHEKAVYYNCGESVPYYNDLAITVTVNNVIQLKELEPEPYFVFKPADQNHPANRFATPDTNAKMKRIAWEYDKMFNPPMDKMITITDMGLKWGGRYNTYPPYNCWVDGLEHKYHRYGRQVDVRSSNIDTPEKRKCFEEICCKYQVQPLLHGKNPGSLLGRDFSNLSLDELDALDKVEHYHLNFRRATDPIVFPPDDDAANCPGVTPAKSACPRPIKYP